MENNLQISLILFMTYKWGLFSNIFIITRDPYSGGLSADVVFFIFLIAAANDSSSC